MRFDIRPRIRRAFRLALRRRDLTAAEVDDEIRFHVESRVDQLIARGLTREQALAEARRRFGLSWDDAVARVHYAGHAREERLAMTERLDAAWRDLAYAARTLWRQPAFSIVVVLTFALGIGANATMFGVIDRLLLRPPPEVANAAVLFELGRTMQVNGEERVWTLFSYPVYARLRADTTAFEDVTAATFISALTLGSGANAEQVYGVFASDTYFQALGTRPSLGRFFVANDAVESEPADVAVVSYGFWQRRFAGDRAILGKTIKLGPRDFTIIGVTREGFTGLDPRRVDVWLPLAHAQTFGMIPDHWRTNAGARAVWLRVNARLRPGVTPEAGAERAKTVFTNIMGESEEKGLPRQATVPRSGFLLRSVLPSDQLATNPETRIARLLLGVAAVVLLIACANVASLMLARGSERRREIAVRLALGGSRARLLRLLVAEAMLLVVAGGVVALAVTHWGLALLQATLLSSFAWTESAFDGRVLAATFALAVVTVALAGLTPAIRSSRPDVVASLKAGGREGSTSLSRARTMLMVVQAALSVVLIVGAGLFAQSLRNAVGVHLGYTRDHVLAATIDLIPLGYDVPDRVALYSAMRDRVARLPGVAAAAISSTHPLQPWGFGLRVRAPGLDSLPRPESGGPYYNAVSGDFFVALGLRVAEGRGITGADVANGAKVAVMSEAMARAYWPGASAVDRCLVLFSDSTCTTVVGVAADAAEDVKGGDPRFLLYLPISPGLNAGANGLLVRAHDATDPARLVEPVRRAIQTAAPNLPYADVQLLDDLLAPQIRPWKMGAVLFSVFGGLALPIAAVGLYSAIAYGVTQRRHEFGVRMALGAQLDDVVRLVLSQGLRAVAAGIVVGSIAALLAGRFVVDLLFQTSPREPVVFVGVAVLILAVAAIAMLIPAWRASRVDPVTALRAD